MSDRADRLSSRRKNRKQESKEADSDNQDNAVETDETVKTDHTDKTDKQDDTGNRPQSVSLTESRKEQMMHLPEDQHKELHHIYNRLKADYEYEFDEGFEMNRHYFPLVLQYGLEQVKQRDLEDMKRDLSSPEESS